MNIIDIARACNVSKTTVSRILNNHPYVSYEKRKKVLDYINMMDYQPNNIAVQLRMNKTRLLGIVLPSIDHPFFSNLSALITDKLERNNYNTVIFQTYNSMERERKILNLLKTNQIDGLILCSVENEIKYIEYYTQYKPIVVCNDYVNSSKISCFYFDEFKIGYIAAENLIRYGCKNISICMDYDQNVSQKLRLEGFEKAIEEIGLHLNTDNIFSNIRTIEDGENLAKYIKQHKIKIDGIFTGSDYVSAGIQKQHKTLKIVGVDNHQICNITTPKLNSIHLPIKSLIDDMIFNILRTLNIEWDIRDNYEDRMYDVYYDEKNSYI